MTPIPHQYIASSHSQYYAQHLILAPTIYQNSFSSNYCELVPQSLQYLRELDVKFIYFVLLILFQWSYFDWYILSRKIASIYTFHQFQYIMEEQIPSSALVLHIIQVSYEPALSFCINSLICLVIIRFYNSKHEIHQFKLLG